MIKAPIALGVYLFRGHDKLVYVLVKEIFNNYAPYGK